jgi:hypothetical protein
MEVNAKANKLKVLDVQVICKSGEMLHRSPQHQVLLWTKQIVLGMKGSNEHTK